MDGCLNRIKVLDLTEKACGLSKDERVSRDMLRKKFQLLAIKEGTFWRQDLELDSSKMGIKIPNSFIGLCLIVRTLIVFMGS